MCRIVSLRRDKDEGRVIVGVEASTEEFQRLKGNVNNVYLFSENNAEIMTNISSRGKNSATKYFLIPKQLRKNLKIGNEVMCEKIETKNKVIFIYLMDKLQIGGKIPEKKDIS